MEDEYGTSSYFITGAELTLNNSTFDFGDYHIKCRPMMSGENASYSTYLFKQVGNEWVPADISEVSGLTQVQLDKIGEIFTKTFFSTQADVNFTGTMTSQNDNTEASDINGNSSLNLNGYTNTNMKLKYGDNSQATLLEARGSDFHVRKICWHELSVIKAGFLIKYIDAPNGASIYFKLHKIFYSGQREVSRERLKRAKNK